MTHENIGSTSEDKRTAQQARFAIGQRMSNLLRERTLEEIESIGVDDLDKIDDTRREVWTAENKAVRLDPLGIFEPENLPTPPLEK